MLRRGGGNRVGHAPESLFDELAQRPSGAISREHVEVMDVDVTVPVRLPRFGREHLVEPIVGYGLAGGVEDQATEGKVLVSVGVNAPIGVG